MINQNRKLEIINDLELFLPQFKELEDKIKKLKEELKTLSEETETIGNIQIIHKTRTTINYKKFIDDNALTVPDEYNNVTSFVEIKLSSKN